jgi:light-harvesting complex II chlorophyll a/b binding protein 4
LLKKSAPTKAKPVRKTAVSKPPVSRPVSAPTSRLKQAATKPVLKGGVGYRKYEGDALWLPNTNRPAWLDGSLPGDRGFDPLGLAKPVEYLQFDLDQLDQNQAQNKAGEIIGSFKPKVDEVTPQSLQPYSEVFGLERFRECELIHGRWAMLATLGVVIAESTTGVSWVDAGKVELDGARYLNFDLPFSISQLCWFEALAVGGAELYRNGELNTEKRIYPGGLFDPLRLATPGETDPAQISRLREAEIKHGRLAMVSFFGFGVQALVVGEGAMGSLAKFATNL